MRCRAITGSSFHGVLVVALIVAVGGCYRSHERATDAGRDAARARDAAIDAPRPCGPSDIQIESGVFTILRGEDGDPSGGTLYVYSADGAEVARDRAADRLEACAPSEGRPLDLMFSLDHGAVCLLGVDSDFREDVWTGTAYRTSNALPPRDPGRVVRSEPSSTFVVHFGPTVVTTITTDTFVYSTQGQPGTLEARFIEVAADGRRVLGGGAIPRGGRDELVLEVTERVAREAEVAVRLPDEGRLAGVPLVDVRPLACDEALVGPPVPGELDLHRCQYSGVGTVTSTDGGVARAQLSYLDGEQIATDHVAVRLDDGEVEAFVVVPCCGSVSEIAFPLVRSIEITGSTTTDLRVDVDAPGFDHAYVYANTGRSVVAYDAVDDGTLRTTAPMGFGRPAFWADDALREAWAGAVTTEGRAPWAAGWRVAMVRRRHISHP